MERLYYTVYEVAERWGVNQSTVYQLLRSGRLKGFKPGKAWRVTPDAIKAYENADYTRVEIPHLSRSGSVSRIS